MLGLREVHLLGYVDGRLDDADPGEAIARIAAHVRRIRPHVVVTFAQDGGYGHPDHVAMAADGRGAGCGGRPRAPRQGAPRGREVLLHGLVRRRVGGLPGGVQEARPSTVDGVERQANPWPEWQLSTRLDTRAYWPVVREAVHCHDSQVANYAGLAHLTPEHHEGLWGWQTFYRVWSTVNGGRAREDDLFAGLRPPPRVP